MFNSRVLTSLLLLSIFTFYSTTATHLIFQNNNNERELQSPKPNQGSQCPSDCGIGDCDQTTGQCVCSDGFFDYDCSFQGSRILPDAKINRTIDAKSEELFYLDMGNEDAEVTLTFRYTKPLIMLIKFASVNSYRVPDLSYRDGGYEFPVSRNVWGLVIPEDYVKMHKGQRLLILMVNTGSANSMLEIQATFSSSTSFITKIMAGLAVFMVALCAITCIFSIRRKRRLRRAREQWRIRQQIRRAQAAQNGQNGASHVDIDNIIPGDENPNQNNIFLKQEELDKFFPEKNFGDLTSKFTQQSCSICLDDFKSDVICRQLYCIHIFHTQCIQLWLKKHQDCPNCKKEMTREAIKKNMASEAKKDRKKGKAKKYEVKEDEAAKKDEPLKEAKENEPAENNA